MPQYHKAGTHVKVNDNPPWYGVVVESATTRKPYKIRVGGTNNEIEVKDISKVILHDAITAQRESWKKSTPTKATIPEIIHFVWIGYKIPDDRLKKIMDWKNNHLNYKVWVWSDSKWKDPLGKINNGFALIREDLMIYRGLIADVGVELKDVRSDADIFTQYYQKEAGLIARAANDPNGAWANFGTASDLLRYYILNKYGGIYADSDLGYKMPGSINVNELNQIINKPRDEIKGNPIQLFLHKRESLPGTKLTNDLIISPPSNSALDKIIKSAHKSLDELYNNKANLAVYPKTDGGLKSYRSVITQETTGPDAVRIYIGEYYRHLSGEEIPLNRIGYKFDALDIADGSPSGSDQSWLLNEVPTPGNTQGIAKSQSLAYSSVFPHREMEAINYENSLAYEPILLNGMKVIFDQPVGVYPVNLKSKEETHHNGT